jgi:hypothetical protein
MCLTGTVVRVLPDDHRFRDVGWRQLKCSEDICLRRKDPGTVRVDERQQLRQVGPSEFVLEQLAPGASQEPIVPLPAVRHIDYESVTYPDPPSKLRTEVN